MSYRNSIAQIVCALISVELGATADEPYRPDRAEPAYSVLLLRSGRALKGQISETESHYVVERSTGRMQLSKGDVEFAGQNLQAVFLYKLKRIDRQKADDYVRLAEWCLLENMHESAIECLERAVELAPGAKRPRLMLDALKTTDRRPATLSTPPLAAEPSEEHNAGRESTAAQREIAAPLISSFSVQLQPMLTRTCATAGCHDLAHHGSFQLQRSSRPVAKLTQQNLRSVLLHVDFDEPDQSELLAYSLRPHGTLAISPIAKGASDPAFATLLDWVRSVAGKPAMKANGSEPVRTEPPSPTVSEPSGLHAAGDKTRVLEREIGEVRAKLDEMSGGGKVYSNRPIPATPSRIRAGMVQPPPPAATAAQPSTSYPGSAAAPATSKAPVNARGHEPQPTNAPTANEPISPPAAPAPKVPAPPAIPAADPAALDPFDPEIFNRQFAPHGN